MKPKIKALLNQIKNGKLNTDKARVLHHIKNHPYSTLSEIERKLNMIHQTASARVSDLLDMGLIQETGTKKTARSQETYFRFQPNFQKQNTNATKRKEEKYKRWVKTGLTQFEEFINPNLKSELS